MRRCVVRKFGLSFVCAALALLLADCGRLPVVGGDGWRPLFNGKNFKGWVVKCRTVDREKTFWSVADGAIVADSMDDRKHDYVWLMTEKEYGDFALRLRFQIDRDSPGNSGLQIRGRYDDEAGWMDGPQIDVNPPGMWRTGMIWDETRGVKRWLAPPVEEGQWVDPSMSKSAPVVFYEDGLEEGWNVLTVTAAGTQLKAELNGVTVTEYDGAGVLDDETHAQRNVGMRGHIALQIHSGDELKIRFKDIEIRELD